MSVDAATAERLAARSGVVHVERLILASFRNLEDGQIEFSPNVNVIVGDNGQGKTNILEAIYLFKYGQSFRAHRDTEMIRFGAPFARAEAVCRLSSGEVEKFALAVEQKGAKKITIGEKQPARQADLVGRYPCVLFGPDDLAIVYGPPGGRRRFIDMVGSMTDPSYIRIAREYRRVLAQRNAALKARASDDELNAWNERIVVVGAELVEKRRDLVVLLDGEISAHATDVKTTIRFGMRYESELLRDAEAMGASIIEGEPVLALSDVFAVKLGMVEQEERRRAITLVGPHRDDVGLMMNGKDLRKYGSQGQRRLFAVLLKLAELTYTEKLLCEPCVLLLDDVFSEFDNITAGKLRGLLDGPRQVFVTTPVPLEWEGEKESREIRVASGHVTQSKQA